MEDRIHGVVKYKEEGLLYPTVKVDKLEPGAPYLVTILATNKKVSTFRSTSASLFIQKVLSYPSGKVYKVCNDIKVNLINCTLLLQLACFRVWGSRKVSW